MFEISHCRVNEALKSLGWRRVKDKTDENFKLKWTELKSAINYNAFKEGKEQLLFIPWMHGFPSYVNNTFCDGNLAISIWTNI